MSYFQMGSRDQKGWEPLDYCDLKKVETKTKTASNVKKLK